MSDEDLEVLVTLDDPPYAPDEDTFDHLDGSGLPSPTHTTSTADPHQSKTVLD